MIARQTHSTVSVGSERPERIPEVAAELERKGVVATIQVSGGSDHHGANKPDRL